MAIILPILPEAATNTRSRYACFRKGSQGENALERNAYLHNAFVICNERIAQPRLPLRREGDRDLLAVEGEIFHTILPPQATLSLSRSAPAPSAEGAKEEGGALQWQSSFPFSRKLQRRQDRVMLASSKGTKGRMLLTATSIFTTHSSFAMNASHNLASL